MIPKLIHWMRLVLPRFEFAMVAVTIAGILEGLYLWMIVCRLEPGDAHFRLRIGMYSLLAAAYGFYRATVFHPRIITDYGRWLANTPWTSRHPLPAGPILLVPQDFVILLCIWGLNHEFSLRSLYIPVAFFSSYQLLLALLHAELDEWVLAYGAGFVLAAECFFFRHPEIQLPISLVCYFITWLGVQRTLKRFPWNNMKFPVSMKGANSTGPSQATLGFPYDVLAPKPAKDLICRHDAICLPILCGWWHLAVLWGADQEARLGCLIFPLAGLMFLAVIRVVLITSSYRSPIDLWGRIWTGRFIIPRYDCIWNASLIAWGIGIPLYSLAIGVVAYGGHYSQLSHNPGFFADWQINLGPLATTGMLLAMTLIGPSQDGWRLTGQHRIVATRFNNELIEI